MSQLDKDKWDQRYREDSYRKTNPVSLLQEWTGRIPNTGRALDIACGAGRNALFLAESGYRVDAIDISREGLKLAAELATARGYDINWIEHDFDRPYDFDDGYQLIVVMWYVNLPLITRLCSRLAPGGYLLCEEHLASEEDVIGPGNPDFRVLPGALRQAASTLDILYYDESVRPAPEGGRLASAQLVARRT